MKYWLYKWMNECMNEWMKKWIIDWKNECMDGQIKEVIKWIDDCSFNNQMKNVNLYEIQLACCDKRVPAGHAISNNCVLDNKTECLEHAGTL